MTIPPVQQMIESNYSNVEYQFNVSSADNERICLTVPQISVLMQLIVDNNQLMKKLQRLSVRFATPSSKEFSNQDELKPAADAYNKLLSYPSDDLLVSSSQQSVPRTPQASQERRIVVSRFRGLGLIPDITNNPVPPISSLSDVRKRPIKIYADGVFDLVHFGHFNAIRQACELGDELYVGVISDEEVRDAKGVYPIYTCQERADIIRSCKWVTGVIDEVPYNVSMEFFKTTGCDFVAHGDDVAVNADGSDCYAEIRSVGLLKTFRRTLGVSTTTLASRLLGVASNIPVSVELESQAMKSMNETASISDDDDDDDDDDECRECGGPLVTSLGQQGATTSGAGTSYETALAKKTLLSSKRISQFLAPLKQPKPADRVVYTDGSFDIFHCGHVQLLKRAKSFGDFLIVGIYDDRTTRRMKGSPHPIQSMLERALNVMAMSCVDEVVIGAPNKVTDFLLDTFKVNVVVRGTLIDSGNPRKEDSEGDEIILRRCELHEVDTGNDFTSNTIIERIFHNRSKLEASLAKRRTKESKFV